MKILCDRCNKVINTNDRYSEIFDRCTTYTMDYRLCVACTNKIIELITEVKSSDFEDVAKELGI